MWSTRNRTIAAAFAGLGFKVTLNETEIIELDQWQHLRFEVSEKSLTHPRLPSRDDLFIGWKDATLEKLDNDHPFLCGIWACHNMEKLMKRQDTAAPFALHLAPGSPLYRYESGPEDPRFQLAPVQHATRDLPLAAAVGLLGLPVIDFDGEPGRRRYLMPDLTHAPLRTTEGHPLSIQDLFQRIENGKPSLALGLRDPQHPLIHAYNGTYAYGEILRQIKVIKKRLLIKDPFSSRRAIVPETPTRQFEDELVRHFRVA